MKQSRVYLFILFISFATALNTSGCARKSGCAAIQSTVKQNVRKDGTPKKKSTSNLFDSKTRRKMGNGK